MMLRRLFSKPKEMGLPVVSVGNIQIGGTGKTPFIIALASRYEKAFVVSRGYGRQSRGLVEVSQNGMLLCDVRHAGDEAFLIAQSLPKSNVIVCENRKEGIRWAKELGAKVVFLDDGFNQVGIKKFDIVLKPEMVYNTFPLPSGPYREFSWFEKVADVVAVENRDFKRVVTYSNLTPKMILVTAIANPKRLEKFLPSGVVGAYYFDDHAYFDEEKVRELMEAEMASSILVTTKDYVKMEHFKLPISIIKLKLEIDTSLLKSIDNYIKGYK